MGSCSSRLHFRQALNIRLRLLGYGGLCGKGHIAAFHIVGLRELLLDDRIQGVNNVGLMGGIHILEGVQRFRLVTGVVLSGPFSITVVLLSMNQPASV